MSSLDRYPSRRHVAWRALDTEAIVVDPKAGMLYPLNSVATRIWQLCDGTHTVGTIVDRLAEEFLEALRAAGLIEFRQG